MDFAMMSGTIAHYVADCHSQAGARKHRASAAVRGGQSTYFVVFLPFVESRLYWAPGRPALSPGRKDRVDPGDATDRARVTSPAPARWTPGGLVPPLWR